MNKQEWIALWVVIACFKLGLSYIEGKELYYMHAINGLDKKNIIDIYTHAIQFSAIYACIDENVNVLYVVLAWLKH